MNGERLFGCDRVRDCGRSPGAPAPLPSSSAAPPEPALRRTGGGRCNRDYTLPIRAGPGLGRGITTRRVRRGHRTVR